MLYAQTEDKKITMTGCDNFDITSILECGQCFRFTKIKKDGGGVLYGIIAMGRRLFIGQEGGVVEFYPATLEEFENLWVNYFDLRRDYNATRDILREKGDIMRLAVEFAPGIRHLKQPHFECLISFIISQNNRIPMIMKSVEYIAEKYGQKREGYYDFPTPEELIRADLFGLAECKVGFRAKYICDAVDKIAGGALDLNKLEELPTAELRDRLKSIKGVGDKIADCVMTFSYGRTEVFPTDVWIIRTMRELFFEGREASLQEIHEYAYENFGENAGMANQYIFYYARENGMCVKSSGRKGGRRESKGC
jgi:N-glycosylase/DNA lyase